MSDEVCLNLVGIPRIADVAGLGVRIKGHISPQAGWQNKVSDGIPCLVRARDYGRGFRLWSYLGNLSAGLVASISSLGVTRRVSERGNMMFRLSHLIVT